MTNTGTFYGRWTVLGPAGTDRSRNRLYTCRCACGTEKPVLGFQLRSGASLSCGCLQVEVAKSRVTHGQSQSVEYAAWQAMWYRCTSPKFAQYDEYKSRVPCERWKTFENFLEDMGPKPSKAHTLERIDNALGYGPQNCCWATRTVQNNNTSRNVKYQVGEKKLSAKELAEYLEMPYKTLRYRLLVQKRSLEHLLRVHKLSKGNTL
jgi:hypothetical protein